MKSKFILRSKCGAQIKREFACINYAEFTLFKITKVKIPKAKFPNSKIKEVKISIYNKSFENVELDQKN